VGRINRLPKGTAENGATYIHATLFAVWTLFEMDEAKMAWEQIGKVLPITHQKITTTPFVMPNSYAFNEERGFDGESMSDWFTGSGCVLMKALLGGAFGIKPTLDGLRIETASYMPCENAEIAVNIKNTPVRLCYKKEGKGRNYYMNVENVIRTDKGVFIPTSLLNGKEITVLVVD
jgi:cellobiose phosphorylase